MNRITLITIATALILGSCGVPQEDFDKLQSENKELKQQLEECQFGAGKLLSQATAFFDDKKYEKCKSEINILLEKHSGSSEAEKGKELFEKANLELEKLAEAKKREEVERVRKEKQRLANATKKMRKKYDDMKGITWYYDKTSPKYVNSRTNVNAYIGKRDNGSPFMRLVIQYVADDWLFIEKYIIKVDGKTYTITEEKYGEIETDNGSGGIWEWLDRSVDTDEYEIIKAIANGKNVKIRFSGKQYYKDRTVSYKEKVALKNIIDAYEALGGTMK